MKRPDVRSIRSFRRFLWLGCTLFPDIPHPALFPRLPCGSYNSRFPPP